MVIRLSVASLCLLWSCLATAQDLSLGDPEAKRHLERGATFFDAKQYAEAVNEFEAGFRVEPDPSFLFAWAQAERLRGNCRGALPVYRRLLRSRPSPRQEAIAKHHLVLCQSLVPRPWYKDPVGDTLVAAGIVGLGLGIGLFFVSANDASSSRAATDYATYRSDFDRARGERTGGIVTVSIGAALAVAGTLELAIGSVGRHPTRAK